MGGKWTHAGRTARLAIGVGFVGVGMAWASAGTAVAARYRWADHPTLLQEAVGNTPKARYVAAVLVLIFGLALVCVGVASLLAAPFAKTVPRQLRERGGPQSSLSGVVALAFGRPLAWSMPLPTLGYIGLFPWTRASPLLRVQLRDGSSGWDGAYAAEYAAFLVVATALGVLGIWLTRSGKQHLAPSATELMAVDPRPPVVYLRSFVVDTAIDYDSAVRGQPKSVPVVERIAGDVSSEEELLVEKLSGIGPVIALGRPGEKLPSLGAARAYVADADWKETVAGWVARARLVVMVATTDTESFWWEIRHIAESAVLHKTVIFPPVGSQYDLFVRRMAEHAPGVRLPERLPSPPKEWKGLVAGVLTFPANGLANYASMVDPHTGDAWARIAAAAGAVQPAS
jgi:hypothetical protein